MRMISWDFATLLPVSVSTVFVFRVFMFVDQTCNRADQPPNQSPLAMKVERWLPRPPVSNQLSFDRTTL